MKIQDRSANRQIVAAILAFAAVCSYCAESPAQSCGLAIGSNVQNFSGANLNVRSCACTTGCSISGTVPPNAKGIIVAGPQSGCGYVWWQIRWDQVNSPQGPCLLGWSAQGDVTACWLQATWTATLTSPSAGAAVGFPQQFCWTIGSPNCSAGRALAFATSASPSNVYIFYASDPCRTVSQSDWNDARAYLGSFSTYYWTVGDVIGQYFYQRATFRSFSLVTPPQQPTNLTAIGATGRVVLGWQDNSNNEDRFVIQRHAPGGQFADYVTVTAPSYTDSGVQNGTSYTYRVAAENSAGRSVYSNEDCATPLATPALVAPPNGARILTFPVTLSWSPVTAATAYSVYVGPSCPTNSDSGTYATTTTNYTIPSLPNGTYWWTVRAVNLTPCDGLSDWTTCWSFTVAPPPPPDIRVEPLTLSVSRCRSGAPGSDGTENGDPSDESIEALVVPHPDRLNAVHAALQSVGARILVGVEERAYWCTVPSRASVADIETAGATVVVDAASVKALAHAEDPHVAALAAEFGRAVLDGREAHAVYDTVHPLVDDVRAAEGGIADGNTGDMTGTVKVAIIFVESNGTLDPDTYTWTTADEDDVLARVASAHAWWAGRAAQSGCTVSFSLVAYRHTDSRVRQGYEPILGASTRAPLWINAVMSNFGFGSGDDLARVSAFNQSLRATYGADRAYTAFVCYNPSPAPTQFTDGYAAWVPYVFGPYTSLLFRSFNWPFDQVFTHETGHIFGACDEYYQAGYGGCTTCSVCTHGVANGNCDQCCGANCVSCMMKLNTWNLCTFTPGQLGWGGCGGGGGPYSFRIFNDGGSSLSVSQVVRQGASCWLSVSPPPPYTIAPGGSQTVSVNIDPTCVPAGTYGERLLVQSNDPDENPYPGGVFVNLIVGDTLAPIGGVAATDGTFCDWVRINWSPVASGGYRVYRNAVNNFATATLIGSPGASPFDDMTATPGTTYYYWVTATNSCGESGVTAPDTGRRGVCTRGDVNCDGRVDNQDIDPFVLALTNPAAYHAAYSNCQITNADINGDGAVNNLDIDRFVVCIRNQGCP